MSGRWQGQGHGDRLGKTGWERQRENRRILERDGYRCQVAIPGVCTGTATEVDHRVNLASTTRPDLLDHDANKRAACSACHKVLTQRQAQAAATRPSRRRPPEPHPGLRNP